MSRVRFNRSVPGGGEVIVGLSLLLGACSDSPLVQTIDGGEVAPGPNACRLEEAFFSATGVVRDGIPALTQPAFLRGNDPDLERFLDPADRVVGFVVDGTAFAVPHNILWYHEIANLRIPTREGGIDLAVTYCPLTGSALVFDRAVVNGAEFGVSGLVYKSNLIMYDRRTNVSLWPQMLGEARCGPDQGTRLTAFPSIEMTWDGWRTLHPDTHVLGEIGLTGPYARYPYGDYEEEDRFGFPMPRADARRPQKERVLGVRSEGKRAVAFPFGSLASKGAWAAVSASLSVVEDEAPVIVFWDGKRRSAMAYHTGVGDEVLTFRADADGIEDRETGSRWSVDGGAISGPLMGTRLEPVRDAYVAFWGAWHAFFPETALWGPGKPLPPSGG
jgi:hypothetical protein